jgi:hypothetical protein
MVSNRYRRCARCHEYPRYETKQTKLGWWVSCRCGSLTTWVKDGVAYP